MKVKLHSNQTGNLSAALLRASVAPSSAEVSPAAGAAALKNSMKRYFIMNQTGMGGLSAAFGPLELSAAKMHSSRLNAKGFKTCVFPEEAAKDEDIHGVNALLIKYPNGYQD